MAIETKSKTVAEREQEAYDNAHTPITPQPTSADMAEAEEAGTDPSAGPVLAPEATLKRRDPNLDPNVKGSVRTGTAGPARTETTRAAAREAGLVNEAKPGDPATTTNTSALFGEAKEARDARVRAANEKLASAPHTTSSAALQDESGQTKPEVAKSMDEADEQIEEDEKAAKEAADKAAKQPAEKKSADK